MSFILSDGTDLQEIMYDVKGFGNKINYLDNFLNTIETFNYNRESNRDHDINVVLRFKKYVSNSVTPKIVPKRRNDTPLSRSNSYILSNNRVVSDDMEYDQLKNIYRHYLNKSYPQQEKFNDLKKIQAALLKSESSRGSLKRSSINVPLGNRYYRRQESSHF